MDTRSKIISAAQGIEAVACLRAEGIAIRAVTGYFDVVLASHVHALKSVVRGSGKLFALVGDPPDPLLPRSARLELAAALAVVDYVIADDAAQLLDRLEPEEVFHLEAGDLERSRQLIKHVQERHRA